MTSTLKWAKICPPWRGALHSYKIYERGLCLPSSCLNSEEDVYFVCKKLREILK